MNRQIVLAAAIALVSGCAAGEGVVDETGVSAKASALVGGTATADFNPIGYLSIVSEVDCTATLIRPRAIITAGHCLSGLPNPAHVLFLFANGRRTAEVLRYVVIGVDGEDDLAIAELSRPVVPGAPDFTEPLPLALEPPEGDTMWIFGYGCENAVLDEATREVVCTEGTSNAKRWLALPSSVIGDLELTPAETGGRPVTTAADSGGPVIGGSSNGVWGIVSDTAVFHGADGALTTRVYFGAVGWHRTEIANALEVLGVNVD